MNDLDSIANCVDCMNASSVLGKSTQSDVGYMFYTISPDPELNDYGGKTPMLQYRVIRNGFNRALNIFKERFKVFGYSMHFELNKNNNLHIHGFLYINKDQETYDIWLAYASKVFHKIFGRQYNHSNISSKFEWIKDYDKIFKYVNKSNIFKPVHQTFNEPKDITYWLTI